MDVYQQRYEAHQLRKKQSLTSSFGSPTFTNYTKREQDTFFKILKNRRSQRVFISGEVDISRVLEAIQLCPSSCDRKGVYPKVISDRHDKEVLSGLLVGGIGWIYRADKILLLFADPEAYKAPGEIQFMPYLDAGVLIQQTYLACEVLNLGVCYVNPNIRTDNIPFFNNRFNTSNHIYCGALALGLYDRKAII